MKGMEALRAILWRDALIAWSYRLDFLMRAFSALFSVVLWFYFSRFLDSGGVALPVGDYFPYIVVGTAMMGYVQVVLHTFSQKLRQEQMTGTLEMLLASPARPFGVLLASALWELLLQTIHTAFFLGLAWAFGARFQMGSVAALAILFVLVLAVFAAMGVMAAALLMVFQRGEPVTPFVGAAFALLGGVFFPPRSLPPALEWVSRWIPLPYALDALRGLLLQGRGFAETAPDLLALTAFCAVLVPSSLLIFTLCLRFARRHGLLAKY